MPVKRRLSQPTPDEALRAYNTPSTSPTGVRPRPRHRPDQRPEDRVDRLGASKHLRDIRVQGHHSRSPLHTLREPIRTSLPIIKIIFGAQVVGRLGLALNGFALSHSRDALFAWPAGH